jgi:hypothetical protein
MYGFATFISFVFPVLSKVVYIAVPIFFFGAVKRLADSLSSIDEEKSIY